MYILCHLSEAPPSSLSRAMTVEPSLPTYLSPQFFLYDTANCKIFVVDFDNQEKYAQKKTLKCSNTTVVLERKVGPNLQTRNARGGGSSMTANRGGPTVGPRGGPGGGAIRRGGEAGTNIPNSNNVSKGEATTTSPTSLVKGAEAVNSFETMPHPSSGAVPDQGTLPISISKPATSDVPDLPVS